MKKYTCIALLLLFICSCNNPIKNEEAKVIVEEGTSIETIDEQASNPPAQKPEVKKRNPETEALGFWVGYFEMDQEDDGSKTINPDEGLYWNRANKINISIDEIRDTLIKGHSVVAGNDRPFSGTIKKVSAAGQFSNAYQVVAKEPGDDRYDGTFTFVIDLEEQTLTGKWKAYKKLDIQFRKYDLRKEKFQYNPNIELEHARAYADWGKEIRKKEVMDFGDGDTEEWLRSEFATSTDKIYELNASNTLLTKKDVDNLKKGDLTIIRNTIYARHGYSFKNRPLRVFFDAQSWYVPVHTNIRADFTDIEKKNIKLLLSYEKNAAEYYDSFGRG